MQQKDGALLGTKGNQYGLQLRAPPGRKLPATAAAAAAAPRHGNVFGLDSDEEEDVGTQVAKQAEKKRAAAKVQKQYEEALTQDASVFDYDGVYDSLQAAQAAPRQADKIQRQSRYIAQLKEQAEKRKRDEDISYERRLLKERKAEDHLFEGKDKFVTSAYRKKLEDEAKWKEEEKKREAEEEANDVRKVGHMGQFYNNLFTRNVAFGGAASTTAATATASTPAAAVVPTAGGVGLGSSKEEASGREGNADREQVDDGDADDAPSTAAGKQPQLDKYEVLRLEAEKAIRRKQAALEQQQRQTDAAAHEGSAAGTSGRQEPSSQEDQDVSRRTAARAATAGAARAATPATSDAAAADNGKAASTGAEGWAAADAAAKQAEAEAALAAASKRRNDEAGVQSARERYLQRKAQKG